MGILLLAIVLTPYLLIRGTIYTLQTISQRKKNIQSFYQSEQQQSDDNQCDTPLQILSSSSFKSQQPVVAVVLGSGGHTSEMLSLLKDIPRDTLHKLNYYISDTDTASMTKVKLVESSLNTPIDKVSYTTLPRARSVGQSYITSIWTTIRAIIHIGREIIMTNPPDIVLCNGPGVCIPVMFNALIGNLLFFRKTQIIFIESLTRVNDLSFTGKIVYPFVHRFIVHWPSLAQKKPLAEYIGVLY